MGWFDKLKLKTSNTIVKWAASILGYAPTFSEFGEDIMNDDTVLTIVNRILDEYSKLNPRHIRTTNGKQVKVRDNQINNLLKFPNKLMTKTDFLRRVAFLRETYDNVFIYPTYDLYFNKKTGMTKKVYTGLYPLQPRKTDFYEDETGTIYVEFQNANGEYSGKLLYDEIIHWRKEYGINEYMGGNKNGLPNNSALLRNLQLNDKLIQSTIKTIEGSLTINGILKYGSVINREDREKARIQFEEQLKNNQSGIIALDAGGDYTAIPFTGKLIDKETLEFFDKKIRQHYGVSEEILNGKYTNEDKEAFYETVLEASVGSLGEAFTRVLLTPFEISNGNEIVFYTNKVQMMSADKKRDLANSLLPIGGVTANEIRSWYGLPPIDDGDEPMMSLNWVKKSIADDYQLELYKNGSKKENLQEVPNSQDDDKNASDSEKNTNDEENDNMKEGDNDEQEEYQE